MVHSWHLFLILNCIICYFLYLSFSSLYSSLHTMIWAKLNKPGVSIKPLPKMLVGGGGVNGGFTATKNGFIKTICMLATVLDLNQQQRARWIYL